MDILSLIKNRSTVRVYQDRPVPRELLDAIIEAGRWGPSVVGRQPWKFVVVTERAAIASLCETISSQARSLGVAGRSVLQSTVKALSSAAALIGVYNTAESSRFTERVETRLVPVARIAEIEAIAACIQNMLLVAEALGVGSGWFDTPLLFSDQLRAVFREPHELVAILAFGYAAEAGRRAPRKPMDNLISYVG